jgi:hypothetical protein
MALFADVNGSLLMPWLGLTLAIVAWLLLLLDTRRLLWSIERLASVDLDGDQQARCPGHFVFLSRQRAKEQTANDREEAEWRTFLGLISRMNQGWDRVTEPEDILAQLQIDRA